MSAITKKKHVSRRSKGAWRKHIDLKDVDDFLEEKGLEERIGTVADKSDQDLFVVDKKNAVKSKKKMLAQTPKQAQRQSARKMPKTFEPLINKSNVQDPIVKRNRVRSNEERKHFIAKSKAEEKRQQGVIPFRIQQAHGQRLRDRETKQKQLSENKPNFNKDLWNEEDNVPEKFKVHWITPELIKYHMYNRGKPMIKPPKITHEKRSQLKAVVVPHPGVSYNPTVSDHTDLLGKVLETEQKIIKDEKHLDRVTTQMFKKMTPAEREAVARKELVQGFPIAENTDTETEESDSETDYQAVNPPARNKKKDRKTRNKEKTAREKKKLDTQANHEVRKIVDINRVPEFKSEIKKTDIELEKSRKRYEAILAAKKFEARRLGKLAYTEPELEFVTGEELSGNLRNLMPAGSVLMDRFKSLQKRNILVPNAKRKAPKSRTKRTSKRSHRNPEDYGIGQIEGLASQIKKAKVASAL